MISIKTEKEIVEKLGRVKIETKIAKEKMTQISTRKRSLQLNISKSIDVEKEIIASAKEIQNLTQLVAKNEGMLKNKQFVAGAPKEIIEATKTRLEEYKEKLEVQAALKNSLEQLKRT